MAGFAETVYPYDASQDSVWDRIRRPLAQGLMQRGTPGGLLIGALLGAKSTPGENIQHGQMMDAQRMNQQYENAQLANMQAEAKDRQMRAMQEGQTGASVMQANGATQDQISQLYPQAKSFLTKPAAYPEFSTPETKGQYASMFPKLSQLNRPTTAYPSLTPPETPIQAATRKHMEALAAEEQAKAARPQRDFLAEAKARRDDHKEQIEARLNLLQGTEQRKNVEDIGKQYNAYAKMYADKNTSDEAKPQIERRMKAFEKMYYDGLGIELPPEPPQAPAAPGMIERLKHLFGVGQSAAQAPLPQNLGGLYGQAPAIAGAPEPAQAPTQPAPQRMAPMMTRTTKMVREPKSDTPTSFNSEEEAKQAGLPSGTIVIINGRRARITDGN
jgi:hypothetical protein